MSDMGLDAEKLDRLFAAHGPYNKADPKSLYNIMPSECRQVFDNMKPDLLLLDEQVLEKKIEPTAYMHQVRAAFWSEYDAAQATNTKMTLRGVHSHIRSSHPSILVRDYLTRQLTLAWVLIPPTHYETLIDEALSRGLRKLREIIETPLYDENGNFNHHAANMVLKATTFLDIRKNGMPTQRTVQEIKQMSVQLTSQDIKQLGTTRAAEIDRKIKELEQQLNHESTH